MRWLFRRGVYDVMRSIEWKKKFSDFIHVRKRKKSSSGFCQHTPIFYLKKLLGSGSISKGPWIEVGGDKLPRLPPAVAMLLNSAVKNMKYYLNAKATNFEIIINKQNVSQISGRPSC